MKLIFCIGLGLLSFQFACGTQPQQQAVSEPSKQQTPEPQTQEPEKERDPSKPRVFVTVKHEETGEIKEIEADVTLKEGEKYFLPSYNPAAAASFAKVDLVDENKSPVKVNLDKVYLIEYWAEEGLTRNLYWSQMRQMEAKYKDNEDIEFLSINYDTTFDGKEQIQAAQDRLKDFSTPANVLFDLNDSFRDSFPVTGPVTYILVDARKQIIKFGRADNPQTQEVFDNVRDALLYVESKKAGGIKVISKSEN